MLQKTFDLSYLANNTDGESEIPVKFDEPMTVDSHAHPEDQLIVSSEQLVNSVKDEMIDEKGFCSQDPQKALSRASAVTSQIESSKNYLMGLGRISKKKSLLIPGFKTKRMSNHNDTEFVAQLLAPVHASELLKKEVGRIYCIAVSQICLHVF